jgi:peptidoglycan hydrolase-like protein with peptidoglycan-binding domain
MTKLDAIEEGRSEQQLDEFLPLVPLALGAAGGYLFGRNGKQEQPASTGPDPQQVAQAARDAEHRYMQNMMDLDKLTQQLTASLKQGGEPAPVPPAPVPPAPVPPTPPKINPKTGKPFNWGELATATGAGAVGGRALGGLPGAGIGALAAGGTDAVKQLMAKESIARTLSESFGYQLNESKQLVELSAGADAGASLAQKAAVGAGTYAATKGLGSMLGKAIPGAGLAFNAADAYDRYKKGDYMGAGISGLSGLAGLVPGVGTAASLGLDAANMYRDYQADKTQGGHPAGQDVRLQKLQKMIGANPDGIMGPETKTKLQAWQQKNGLTPDGIPGPQTYGKAGIKESSTVSEDIRTLQQRLELIETKARIAESLDSEYYFDTESNVYDTHGNIVTDRLTLDVIWESVKDGEVVVDEGLLDYAKGAWNGIKNIGSNFAGGLGGQAAKQMRNAAGTVDAAGKKIGGKMAGYATGAKTANKVGQAIRNNPGKTALGVGALGAGAYGLSQMGDEQPAVTTAGGGGTGGAEGLPAGTTANVPADVPADATKPEATKERGLTPEQQGIIDKMNAILEPFNDTKDDGSPLYKDILGHVQPAKDAIAQAQKFASEKVPAKGKEGTPTGTTTATPVQAAPAGTTSPAGTQVLVPKIPAGTTVDNKGVAIPDPTLKVYKDGGGAGAASNPANVKESEDELARWLRIARG